MGFLKYVEYQKSKGESKLFPSLSNISKEGKHRDSGRHVSHWFNEDSENSRGKKVSYFTSVGIGKANRNIVLYSFKHTAQVHLINHPDNIEHNKIDTLFGHTVVNTGRLHYGEYYVNTILELVEKNDYPEANLIREVNERCDELPFPWER